MCVFFAASTAACWENLFLWTRSSSDHMDELWEPHCRRQLRQEPCINKINSVLPTLSLLIYVSSSTVICFSGSCEFPFCRKSLKTPYLVSLMCKLREYYFYRQFPWAATLTCARRLGIAIRFVATSGIYRFILLNSLLVKVASLFQFSVLIVDWDVHIIHLISTIPLHYDQFLATGT